MRDDLLRQLRYELLGEKTFPRDLDIPRKTAYTLKHYLTVANRRIAEKKPGYVAVYSEYEWRNRTITALMFDIDGKDVLDSSRFVLDLLSSIEVFHPGIYYTGGRGYHVLIILPETSINKLREVEKCFLDMAKPDGWKDYVDRQKIGDYRKMTRIIATINEETGYLVQVIRRPRLGQENIELAEALAAYDSSSSSCMDRYGNIGRTLLYDDIRIKANTFQTVLTDYPPCILHILSELRSRGEMIHPGRIQLALFLLSSGFTVDEVVEIFKLANDYDEHVSRYQVEYLYRRLVEGSMKMYGCDKMISLGLCPGKCRYYPSLNIRWVKYEL